MPDENDEPCDVCGHTCGHIVHCDCEVARRYVADGR